MKLMFFQFFGLFDIILLAIIYFSKKRLKNYENRIYQYIIIGNIIGEALHILSFISIRYLSHIPIVNQTILKLYLLYLIIWLLLNAIYILIITQIKENYSDLVKCNVYKKILNFFWIVLAISVFIIIFLPTNFIDNGIDIYSYGLSVDFVYIMSIALIIICGIIVLLNIKTIEFKKIIPILTYMIFGGIVMVIQKMYPQLLLITSTETFITLLMYFTIENPDVKMIEQLNIAKEQAVKANNAKSDFLSNMSHEIRTPLNAIVGFSQALSSEELPPQAKEEVKDILMASDTLLDIVNGILDISKIEANKLEIVNTEYNFNKIVEELVALTRARLGEKPLDLRINIDHSVPEYLYGDKVRVKQVILNLLTNAVKYTKEGWIEFKISSVQRDGVCRLIIAVEDTGIGIKPESINKLFTKFERLDIERNNTIEGTGLGLAITKKLLELMGGQIVVQSVYGRGSKFTIALDQRIVVNPTIIEETSAVKVEELDLSNKSVLIVDDNKINLKVATRLLSDYHCQIDTTESGYECIEKIKNGITYDLILMDDMMPKMGGIETLHHLQEIPGYNIPTVALTANAISGMREKYLAEGFDDYLAKPIEKPELYRVLVKFLIQK